MHAHDNGEDDEQSSGSPRAVTHVHDLVLCAVLTASWSTCSLVRDKLAAWLRAHHWPPKELDDVVLAVSEAASNAVEHGYRIPRNGLGASNQTVRLMARIQTTTEDGRYLDISIKDRGRWRTPRPQWTPIAGAG